MAFGTHFQRLGLNVNFYYTQSHFQANSEARIYFSFRSLGPRLRYPELVLSQGVLYSFGREITLFNPFLNSVSNQTTYGNSLAYSYNAYFNKKRTTQQTGTFAIEIDGLSFITEDDLLARPALDRFRTGAILLQYRYEDQFQAAINCTMWTGSMGHKHEISDSHFYSKCYMDTTAGVYANTSHGLLSAQFKYHVGYSQNVQANIGIDAEQVRNALQNYVIHDMRFLPKKLNKGKNCHIPMIDSNGNQFLYKEGQVVRRSRLLMNVYSNASIFY